MFSVRSMGSNSNHLALPCVLLLAIFLSSLAPAPAHAEGASVTVRATSPAPLDIEPGSTTTLSFQVSNTGAGHLELEESFALPPGWRPIIGASCFELGSGNEELRFAVFHVPLTTPAGSYTLGYDVTAVGGSIALDHTEIEVGVLPTGNLTLLRQDTSSRAIAGDELRVRFSVTNRGNIERDVDLRAASSESYPMRVDPGDLSLTAGESRIVTVIVETPRELDARVVHILTVEATARGLDAEDVTAALRTVQEITPRVSGKYDPYHTVPSVVRVVCVGEDDAAGVQIEFSGRGGLAESGGQTVDFFFRGPDTKATSLFGLRDEYALRIAGPAFDFRVGDDVYELSPLTARRRYGRGVGMAFELGSWNAAASYFKTRLEQPDGEEGLARLTYRHGDRLALGLNYVRQQSVGRDILSIDAASELFPSVEIELEYAVEAARANRRAYRGRVRGTHGEARYFLEAIRAGEDYSGCYSDEAHTTASVSLPVVDGLRLNANYHDRLENSDGDEDEEESAWQSVVHQEAHSVGLKTSSSSGLRAAFDYRDVQRDGRAGETRFDYVTRTMTFALEGVRGRFSVGGSLEFGMLRDRLEHTGSGVDRYSVHLQLKPDRRWRISGHFQSALTASPDPTGKGFVAGVDAELSAITDLTLAAGVQRRGNTVEGTGDDRVTARAVYALSSGHSVTGEVRWTRYGPEREPTSDFTLAYEIPIGLPVARKQSAGRLSGRVFDEEDPLRPGVEDVVLVLDGATAVTDERGEYVFPSLEPGDHYLTIDAASIGLHRVSTTCLPKRITIAGGEDHECDLGVARSCRLKGRVMIDDSSDDLSGDLGSAGVEALPALFVEARRDAEILRQLTDDRGEFRFGGLRPGRWVLTIGSDGLSRFQKLAQDTFTVDIPPSAEECIDATVVPCKLAVPILERLDVPIVSAPR